MAGERRIQFPVLWKPEYEIAAVIASHFYALVFAHNESLQPILEDYYDVTIVVLIRFPTPWKSLASKGIFIFLNTEHYNISDKLLFLVTIIAMVPPWKYKTKQNIQGNKMVLVYYLKCITTGTCVRLYMVTLWKKQWLLLFNTHVVSLL